LGTWGLGEEEKRGVEQQSRGFLDWIGGEGKGGRGRGLGFCAPSGCVFPNCSDVWGP
jgi:hypothetical protein